MAVLIYSAITSLDGYIEDETGGFEWAAPDNEVMRFLNDLERPIGTYLYGRRMYETMLFWETAEIPIDDSPTDSEWAQLWRAADKVVFSRSLESISSARTLLERHFDPAAIQSMKESADRDITIGGPELAAEAFRAGLVDRCQLFLTPVIVGGGKSALPAGVRADLDLVAQHSFSNGVVFVDYRVR